MKNPILSSSLIAFIAHFLKPYRRIVILFISFAALAGFWGPFNSLLLKNFINLLASPHGLENSHVFWIAGFLVLNFLLFDNVTWRSLEYLNYKYQARIKTQIIEETFDYVLGASHQYFQDNLSGRIADQIMTLANNMEIILHRVSVDFIRGTSLLLASFITAFYVNVAFFYILLLWFIVFATYSIWMSKRLVHLADEQASCDSQLSGQLVDALSNQANIRIFAQKKFERARMQHYFQRVQRAFQKKELFVLLLCCAQGAMIALMMGISAFTLIYLYKKHLISLGDFALILGLSMELGHMMWYTMFQVDQFNQAMGKCKQSLQALLVQQDIVDHALAKEMKMTRGEIELSAVQFHYKGAKPLFSNTSIKIPAGQKVGLVGYSGSGKSTLVNLILRLYEVTGGEILIDGQNIQGLTQDSLRQTIALIPQDTTLFQRNLMENIRYGRNEASDAEVISASKKADAHAFIQSLPEAYDTLVGERGIKLSGGQRQRIAIARAVLKNAPILILDEATSQLDSLTEATIQESLWELMQGKTTLVIAHRLSTLLHMDRILVFDKGEIIEDGSHRDLLKKQGLYKTLWDAQVGGFLPDKAIKASQSPMPAI